MERELLYICVLDSLRDISDINTGVYNEEIKKQNHNNIIIIF